MKKRELASGSVGISADQFEINPDRLEQLWDAILKQLSLTLRHQLDQAGHSISDVRLLTVSVQGEPIEG